MSRQFPSLPNIEYLIDCAGEITLGMPAGFACTATACKEDLPLPMLVRHDNESLDQFLAPLDGAIDKATEGGIVIDEICMGPDR